MRSRGLLLGSLLLWACGHGASSPWAEAGPHWEEGVRTKGGDSATARIPVLIARGEYAEAEVLIKEAMKAGLLAGGYAWTQSQYFVGASGGKVAVFRGLPTGIGPIDLSRVVETSDVAVDDLPVYLRERVTAAIHADSLDDARHQVQLLADETVAEPSPVPTFTPAPVPTFM